MSTIALPQSFGRRCALVATVVAVVVAVWLFAFFLPQTRKLLALNAERATLEATVARDNARLQQVRSEAHHVGQIETMHQQLEADVPPTASLYTYIRTLSGAAKVAGVSVTTLQPSTLVQVPGTPYSAVPITASVKGSYDHVLAFLKALYTLSRLTDVNALTLSGGGPGTNRGSPLTVSLQLAVFTSQAPGITAPGG